MIKANLISDHSNWKKILKKPNEYLKKRLNVLSKSPSFRGKNHEFSILLTNNKEMRHLNNKFRKKNKVTDVLSFPIRIIGKRKLYVGDIAISYEIVNKRSHKSLFCHELDKMWIHGYLHLIGYDHVKNIEFKKMYKKENLIFKQLNFLN